MSGSSYSTPQINFLQKQKELREQQSTQQAAPPQSAQSPQSPRTPQSPGSGIYTPDKPPIPPRGIPPPVPNRQASTENIDVTMRSQSIVGMYHLSNLKIIILLLYCIVLS